MARFCAVQRPEGATLSDELGTCWKAPEELRECGLCLVEWISRTESSYQEEDEASRKDSSFK